jgi:hypothetical protein
LGLFDHAKIDINPLAPNTVLPHGLSSVETCLVQHTGELDGLQLLESRSSSPLCIATDYFGQFVSLACTTGGDKQQGDYEAVAQLSSPGSASPRRGPISVRSPAG